MNKTKRKIFETSMKLFAEKGYDATSIEEITATVGVAKGTLYYHFSSKEEIFNFLVEEGIKLLQNSIDIKTAKFPNYIDKLKAIVLIQIKIVAKYEDIITIVRDDNGNIKMLQTNIKSVNELTSDIPNNIVSALKSEENSNISIYLGSILGLKILSAQGPKINVRIANVGNVETSLESQFVEQGINQTLHRIYLEIVCEVSILTPYDTISEKITNQVLIAESVIVGNVPDAYYNIQTNDSVGDSLTLVD